MGNLEIAFHVQRFYHRLTAAGVTQVTVNQHLDQQHRELGEGRRRSRNFRSSTVHNAVRLLRERPNAPSGWQVSTKLMMLDALDILRCTCVDGSSAPQVSILCFTIMRASIFIFTLCASFVKL